MNPKGARNVAIVLLSIETDLAARVLQHLGPDEVEAVTEAMLDLEGTSLGPDEVHEAMQVVTGQLHDRSRLRDGIDSVLERAFGSDPQFAIFETLPPVELAGLLNEEHPQIAAVFLAHLERHKAAAVLRHVPQGRRADLIYRISTLDRMPRDLVMRVLNVMRKKVETLGLDGVQREPRTWIRAAADILKNLEVEDQVILDRIGAVHGEVANAIRDEMFTFDEMARLDRKAMQRVLSQVGTRLLATALKAASQDVVENVLNNLTKRAADTVMQEQAVLPPMRMAEVRAAQQEILRVARELVDEGRIKLAPAGETLV